MRQGIQMSVSRWAGAAALVAALALGAAWWRLGPHTPPACGALTSAPAPAGPITGAATALPALVKALADGPIQVRPAKPGLLELGPGRATGAAQAATGWQWGPNTWLASVTDREFPDSLVQDRPCWIVPLDARVRLPDAKGQERPAPLYAVVDARSGMLLEAFSVPVAPWWKRMRVRNAAAVRSMAGMLRAALPASAPSVTLSGVLAKVSPGELSTTQQLIVRYILYTSTEGRGVSRAGGEAIVPWDVREPVWLISKEGIHQIFNGSIPPPAPGHQGRTAEQMPRDEEENLTYSAVTGHGLDDFYYRR